MPEAIICQGLVKTYPAKPPVQAVRGLDLSVKSGECFGLLGPNGAGKTTTVEILEGLLEPTSGTVEVLGMNWKNHSSTLREKIGISLQETKLPEKLTVMETVRLFRSFYQAGISPDAALALVSLQEKSTAWTSKLSGGQKQRLAVACALVGNPELLFLDEPTTGLDPQARRQLWDIVSLWREKGRTILLTTHYMDEAEKLCDRVAVIDHGKVIALGSPKELIAELGGGQIVEISFATSPALERFQQIESVTSVHKEMDQLHFIVQEVHVAVPGILRRLQELGLHMTNLVTRTASLEDVFVKLTGRHLRDDQKAA